MIKKNILYSLIVAVVTLIIVVIVFVLYTNITLNKKKTYTPKSIKPAIPSSLSWGSDFNHDYEKIKKEKENNNNPQGNVFKYFKNK